MPVFTYKALGNGGSVVTGELSAADRGEALRQLDRKGLQPVKVAEASVNKKAPPKRQSDAQKAVSRRQPKASTKPEPAATKTKEYGEGPIKMKSAEVVYFTEELSDMLSAGLQLEPALRSMESREEEGNIKEISNRIRNLAVSYTHLTLPTIYSV